MAEKEKRYGLIDNKKKMTVADVFNNDSDSGDERGGRDWIKKKRDSEKGLKKQTVIDMNRALEQDPTVYQYDEVYDDLKNKESEKLKPKVEKKAKYMDALLKTADRRKKENERRTERQVQKEREAEGEMFKDKEEFITSAYRLKLEEMKQAEEEEKKMEYIESLTDVTKQKDMGSFYRQLYKETIADPEANGENSNSKKESEENKSVEEKLDIGDKRNESSSSSSDSDSSSDTSSSSNSSNDKPHLKSLDCKEEEKLEASKPEKNIKDDGKKNVQKEEKEIVSKKEEKVEERKESTVAFHSTNRKDRTYRQRESVKEGDREQRSSEQRNQRNDKGSRVQYRERSKDRRGRRSPERRHHHERRGRSSDRTQSSQRHRSRSKNGRDFSRDHPKLSNEEKGRQGNKRDRDKENVHTDQKKKVAEVKEEKSSTHESPAINGDKDKPAEPKVDIWKKRTVGLVFDAALERYFQRQAIAKN